MCPPAEAVKQMADSVRLGSQKGSVLSDVLSSTQERMRSCSDVLADRIERGKASLDAGGPAFLFGAPLTKRN